ncbi:MAG: CocE/NonD family hydrolase, partial [Solirubrobacteraceae bacterium]
MSRRLARHIAALLGLVAACSALPAAAQAATVTQPVTFTASDGAVLRGYVSGDGDLRARPLIVQFSPYGETSFEQQFAGPASFGRSFGPAYNYLIVNQRGTGSSTGTWTAEGARDQQDISEVLSSACHQSWSSGHIGLYGFSASAIAIYNSLHLPLACVDTATLMAGTADLYRDLLYPGGIPNIAPAAVVGLSVGGMLLGSAQTGLQHGESPASQLQAGTGLAALSAQILAHQSEDSFWADRTQRPDVNTFPVLADTSFYDPEARGPFESFKLLRSLGSHFLTFGAHDGYPVGTQGPFPEFQRWFDHALLRANNGVERDPVVQLFVGNGSREALLSGNFTRINAADWPVPGTRWERLYLDPSRAGSARSLNDGTLSPAPPSVQSAQAYLGVPSLPTASDPHTTAALGAGVDTVPQLTQMNVVDPVSLTYTMAPFSKPVNVVGPASLDVFASTTTPGADIHAVVADVAPDGTAYPVGQGRLRTSYPNIFSSRSQADANGEIVQPYGDYSAMAPGFPLQAREYHVEFWPLGNHFAAGHRLRLYLLGTSGFMLPSLPGV